MRSERGSILILTAISMTAVLGVVAFTLDASRAYELRHRLNAVADAAAKAGAMEIRRGNDTNMVAFAQRVITDEQNAGRIPTIASPIIRFCDDVGETCAPPYSTHSYVEVILDSGMGRSFAGALGFASLTPRGRAVAGIASGTACFTSLGPMTWGNNNTMTLTGCTVQLGGATVLGNGSSITADSIGIASTATGGTYSPTPVSIPKAIDPFESLPPLADPSPSSSCTSLTISTNTTIGPGKYCDIYFASSATLTLNPGEYYITGRVYERNGGTAVTITGSDVLLFMKGSTGQIDLSQTNGLTMTLTGRLTGTYKGIAIYQERGNTSAMNLGKNGNAGGLQLNGAIYVPDADVAMKNHSPINSCSIFVVKSLDPKNGMNLSDDCGTFGGSPLKTTALAE